MNNADNLSINRTGGQGVRVPRVVIVGGGFGGLSVAKALRRAAVQELERERGTGQISKGVSFLHLSI